eukprot:g27950.t1
MGPDPAVAGFCRQLCSWYAIADVEILRLLQLRAGCEVWRRHWAHECNYPELILERYLVDQHLPVRYTRDICFVRLRRCKEQSFEDHCKVRPGGAGGAGAWDDLEPWRRWHLQGMEVLPEQTFPAQYEHDPVLAAKLVDFFHAEQRKVGRPLKIVDLGCGRGTLEPGPTKQKG